MPEVVDGRLRVWTDGSCYPNPGPGGWAWALDRETFASGPARVTTNNRMEMMAAIRAIQANEGPLEVFSDSQYVCNCFVQGWHVKWAASGWRHKGEDRKNRDLWEPFVNLVLSRDIKFTWVKGHAGNDMNEFVDELCGATRKGLG